MLLLLSLSHSLELSSHSKGTGKKRNMENYIDIDMRICDAQQWWWWWWFLLLLLLLLTMMYVKQRKSPVWVKVNVFIYDKKNIWDWDFFSAHERDRARLNNPCARVCAHCRQQWTTTTTAAAAVKRSRQTTEGVLCIIILMKLCTLPYIVFSQRPSERNCSTR